MQESIYTPAGSFPAVRTEVRSHTYGDSTWRDRLTEFNGNNITYDNIGNPTAIGTANLTWQGRTLTQYADGANTYSYEYDMSGHRISKTVNGVKTTYYYDGDQLVAQQSGNNRITFMFDANGSAFGFYYNNAPYFFIKNIQGDVTAITNFAGTVIGTYAYDAWGNLIPEASDLSDEVAAMNPIRYRGYYYDAETGYYFLNTRYYSAEMGRFLNADSVDVITATLEALTDKNLYSYCDNNPVVRADSGGDFWHIVVGAGVGLVSKYISDVSKSLLSGQSFADSLKPSSSWIDYLAATASGAIAATGIGLAGSVIANASIEGVAYLGNCAISGEGFNSVDFALNVAVGGISGLIGGKGANGKKLIGVYKRSSQVLETAVSPRKIARYTAKKINCVKTAAESIARTATSVFFSAGANDPVVRKYVFKELQLERMHT